MTQTHISPKLAKALNDFLRDNAPEPISKEYYIPSGEYLYTTSIARKTEYPAYRLEDLLSKPFCEAMFENTGVILRDNGNDTEDAFDISAELNGAYYDGGLPAVEKELFSLMGGK